MKENSIVVVGAGGNIGSHLVPHLARMLQVGRVTLIDRDTYEPRNATNQNIVASDYGESKALVQARRLLEIRPNLEVLAIHAPLESAPLGTFRSDLILACLDSRVARQALAARAWHMGTVWADSGVLGSEWLARVNVYMPTADTPCLECPWSDDDYRLLEQQYPCGGELVAPAPNDANAELGALAAAMLAAECRKILNGNLACAATGRQVTFNAQWHQLAVTSFHRNPHCRFDHATWAVQPLRCQTRRMCVSDLLALVDTIRVPDHRFVRRLVCRACGIGKSLFYLEAAIKDAERQCPKCRARMAAPGFEIIETLNGGMPAEALRLTLDQVGLRYGDVLQAGDAYFEIAADGGSDSGI